MSPQMGSIVLYVCAAVMGLLGGNHLRAGNKGRAVKDFFMAGLMVLFAVIISMGGA